MYLRVKAVLPEAIVGGFGGVVEGVIGTVHDGVLAEHSSHICGGGDLTDRVVCVIARSEAASWARGNSGSWWAA